VGGLEIATSSDGLSVGAVELTGISTEVLFAFRVLNSDLLLFVDFGCGTKILAADSVSSLPGR